MLNRRSTLKLMGAAGAATLAAPGLSAWQTTGRNAQPGISRIAFGSCARQDKEQPIWDPVNALSPDLFIFLGDNIYGDTRDMAVMAQKYEKLAAKPGFRQLRDTTPVIATWDDHDFGENDAGREYPMKQQSKDLFMKFWQEPKDSVRWQRDDGIYTSYEYGPEHLRVQVIMLDLRWNRTALHHVDDATAKRRDQMGLGPYLPWQSPGSTMMGEKQWAWLRNELKKPAKLRIIGSSTQFISVFPGWEAWGLFPSERQRMINLITETKANGVMFISGDTHWAEISRQDKNVPYPLYDFTSSGLTETWHNLSPNAYRLPGCIYTKVNFGVIEIDWGVPDPLIFMQARGVAGEPAFEKSFLLSELSIT